MNDKVLKRFISCKTSIKRKLLTNCVLPLESSAIGCDDGFLTLIATNKIATIPNSRRGWIDYMRRRNIGLTPNGAFAYLVLISGASLDEIHATFGFRIERLPDAPYIIGVMQGFHSKSAFPMIQWCGAEYIRILSLKETVADEEKAYKGALQSKGFEKTKENLTMIEQEFVTSHNDAGDTIKLLEVDIISMGKMLNKGKHAYHLTGKDPKIFLDKITKSDDIKKMLEVICKKTEESRKKNDDITKNFTNNFSIK